MLTVHRKKLIVSLAVLAVLGGTGIARGVMVGFQGIAPNNLQDAATGQQQLSAEVLSLQANQAAFTFYNTGLDSAVITQIYFEAGPLADLAGIYESAGVSFHEGGNPKSLPGGNNLSPSFNTAFAVSADNPSPHNGVSNSPATGGEWVRLVFDLKQGVTFQDLLQDMANGSLRLVVRQDSFPGAMPALFAGMQDLRHLATPERRLTLH
jgi:hypothetical protein